MVTLLKNNFDGQTSGATITVANSATSGDPFSHVVAGTGAAWTYQTSAGIGGTTGAQLAVGSTSSYLRLAASGTDGRRGVARRTFIWGGTSSAIAPLLDIRTEVSATTSLGDLHVRTSGQLEVRVGNSTYLSESRHSIPANGTYHVELAITASSADGANDGKIEYRLYAADGTTLVHSWSSGSDQPVTHSPPSHARFSMMTTGGMDGYDRIDNVQALFTDDLDAWLGPYPVTKVLATPDVSVTATVSPSSPNASDGSITLSWPKIADADVDHYEVGYAVGHGVTSGFTVFGAVAQPAGATASTTITGLPANNYTVAVRSMPEE